MATMIERLQRRALRENRLDDANLEVIKKRLETYESETKQVLDFYGPEIVHTIDATQSPLDVLREILNTIAQIKW
jgi:adenylate kinase